MGKPVADGPIAYLVMVLCKYDKLIIGISIRMAAECTFAMSRINAIIDIGIPECFFEMAYVPKVFIVGIGLPGQKGTQSMMELVDPLSVETISSLRRRVDITGIIEVYFRDQLFFAVAASLDVGGQLF